MMKHAIPILVLGLAVVLVFPACGDKGEDGPAANPVAGSWEMNAEATIESLKASDDPKKEMYIPMMEQSQFTVEISADGTWTSLAKFPGGPNGEVMEQREKGTWERDGEKVTIVTTHRDGEEKTEKTIRNGTWKEDEIRARQKTDKFDMVLRRKK